MTPQTDHSRLKYATLNASVRQALLACDIHCKASTHTSRKWGAQLAEQGGAPEEEISKHGRWCTGVMETIYLSHFPRKALRVLAGFSKKNGAYDLSRDIHVPKVLADQVFPWLDNAYVFGVLRLIDAKGQDTNASLVELRKTVLEERRSEKYDALLVGIGDAFHAIARDLRQEGPSRG